MKKNGFTLIELLAVVILMGIIAGIVVPTMEVSITNSKKDAFKSDVATISKAIEIYLGENSSFKFQSNGTANFEDMELDVENLKNYTGNFSVVDDRISFNIIENADFCGKGNIENLEVYNIDDDECDIN